MCYAAATSETPSPEPFVGRWMGYWQSYAGSSSGNVDLTISSAADGVLSFWANLTNAVVPGFGGVLKLVDEDGTWRAVSPNGSTNGVIRVEGGRALYRSYTTGRNGIYTLHEGEGQRVLRMEGEGRHLGSSQAVGLTKFPGWEY